MEKMLDRAKRSRLRNKLWPYVAARQEYWNVPRAISACRKIADSDRESLHILICDHIGDFIHTMGYVDALRYKTGFKRVTLYITDKFAPLVDMYPGITDKVVTMTPKKLYRLLQIDSTEHGSRAYRGIKNLIIVNPANAFSIHTYDYAAEYPNICFVDCIRYGCLSLGENSAFRVPNTKDISGNCTSDIESRYLKNAVIIIPQARYLPYPDVTVLRQVTERFKDRGYEVYTSMESEAERPLEGTDSLVCSLTDLIKMAPKAKLVLGIRSGVLDLLAYTDSRLAVVYTGTDAERKFFSLKEAPQTVADIREYSEKELLDYAEHNDSLI